MKEILHTLLEQLSAIGEDHEEVYDTDVRERMRQAIFDGFLQSTPHFSTPRGFGMFTEEGNRRVRDAIDTYISAARSYASDHQLNFPARLAAFQDSSVVGPNQVEYSEFFGHVSPEEYDSRENLT